MKLIHTADIHLDTSYAWAARPGVIYGAGFGTRRRQNLRSVFQGMMQRASEWPADAVFIAGDLFELDRLQWDTVAFLREMFELIRPIPVFIAAGECDPCTNASPYVCEEWPPNVHIFRKPVWSQVELPGLNAVVHGMGFDQTAPESNPLAEGLALEADGRTHIAVAHGAERGHLPPGAHEVMSFPAKAMDRPGLSYLALGHFHEVTPISRCTHTAIGYPGSPEGHGFAAPGIHYYLEVELGNEDGPVVRPVSSSRTVFERRELDCTDVNSSSALTERVEALRKDGPARALQVVLTGRAPRGLQSWLNDAMARAADAFEMLAWLDRTVGSDELEMLARQSTSLGAFAERMVKELADAPDDARRRALRRTAEVGIAAYRNDVPPLPGARGTERAVS